MLDVRSHREGSIYRRADGLLVVAVSWPDGSRRRKYVPKSFAKLKGNAELREANRLLGILMAERDAGADRPSRLTLAAWLHLWIDELAASDRVRQPSVERYASIVDLHIIPGLGAWPLADLSVAAVQGWVDGMRDRSAKQRLGVLHSALDVAEGRGMVRRNVTRWVAVAEPSDFRSGLLTAEQAAALVAGTRDDWYGPLWALLLGASLRINEALGLGWADFDGASIAVTTQLARRDGAWVRVPWVKADRELERIALPPFAVAALDTQRVRLAAARKPDWGYHGHVFLTPTGLPPHRSTVNPFLHAALKRLGLPQVRPHDLRGTSLTILREQGIDEQTRMSRAGHHSVAMARHYARTVTSEDVAAAAALQEAIGG
jgi:integrase